MINTITATPHRNTGYIERPLDFLRIKFSSFSNPMVIKDTAKGKAGSKYLMPSCAGLIGSVKIRKGKEKQINIRVVLGLLRIVFFNIKRDRPISNSSI